MKKRKLTAALLALGSALGISGCGDEPQSVYGPPPDITYDDMEEIYGPPSYFGIDDDVSVGIGEEDTTPDPEKNEKPQGSNDSGGT